MRIVTPNIFFMSLCLQGYNVKLSTDSNEDFVLETINEIDF